MHFTGHFYYLRKALAEYEMCRKIYDFITYGFFHSLNDCILFTHRIQNIFIKFARAHNFSIFKLANWSSCSFNFIQIETTNFSVKERWWKKIWTVSSHWNNKNENKLEYWRFYRWAASMYTVYGIIEGRYTDRVLKDTSNFVMTV